MEVNFWSIKMFHDNKYKCFCLFQTKFTHFKMLLYNNTECSCEVTLKG